MMADMILQRVLIVDGQNLLVAISDDYHLLARLDALLCASRAGIASHLGAALGIGDVALNGGRLAHIIER
jgi:hypothetical protein